MSFDIQKIADLARLELKPEEKAKLEKDLAAVLSYVDDLRGLNTSAVEATSHVFDMENIFREDVTHEANVRDKALKYAPQTEGMLFKVPKTVDKES